jgi:hypothetical protein
VFGHAAGDELLVMASEAIKKVCREGDIIARLGGDEFVILLPKTINHDAQQIISRIRDVLSREKAGVIRCSMSLGCDTKTSASQKIDMTVKNAENEMYKEKALNRNRTDTDMLNAIIMSLYSKSPPEEQHAANVSEICRSIAEALESSFFATRASSTISGRSASVRVSFGNAASSPHRKISNTGSIPSSVTGY